MTVTVAKKITELRIVFMGTPEFAVASLDALVKAIEVFRKVGVAKNLERHICSSSFATNSTFKKTC